MTALAPAYPVSVLNVSDLWVERSWVHQGHALYLVRDIEYGRDPAALWVAYYRPRPLTPLPLNPVLRKREIQILATATDWEEVARLADEAIEAGAAETPPDPEQTRFKAESLDREAGIAGFISPEKVPQIDVVPFRYDPSRPPMPEDGLQIGRDDAGTWRTYQERYPASTLTAGHATNVEAYWACHALRELAAWATTVDIRAEVEGEPQRCQFARESLAGRVERVGEDFARWRKPVEVVPTTIREVKGVAGLRLARFGRDWSVVRAGDGRTVLGGISSLTKATKAARALDALGDLGTVPAYVLPSLPALREDFLAIRCETTGLSPESATWAEKCRDRAAEIREAVAAKAAQDTARRRR